MYGFVNLLKKTHRTRSANFGLCSPACKPTKHCRTKRKAASKTKTYSSAPKGWEHFVPTTHTTSAGPQLRMGTTSAHHQSLQKDSKGLFSDSYFPIVTCWVVNYQHRSASFMISKCWGMFLKQHFATAKCFTIFALSVPDNGDQQPLEKAQVTISQAWHRCTSHCVQQQVAAAETLVDRNMMKKAAMHRKGLGGKYIVKITAFFFLNYQLIFRSLKASCAL